MTVQNFGETAAGQPTHLVTLEDHHGLSAQITDFGATLVALGVPGNDGHTVDVTWGFDSVADYQAADSIYFGATIGRVASRTAGATFTLHGHTHQLTINEGANHLHGGTHQAFDRVLWRLVDHDQHSARFHHVSVNGSEGYPGTVSVWATYELADGVLTIRYEATTDVATPLNLTNHTYFNLAGAGASTILDHVLELAAQAYTPVDARMLPTGEVTTVAGTPLDFTTPRRVGERIEELARPPGPGGYDHNLVLNGSAGTLRPAAILRHVPSGRTLRVSTNQPCLQLYSAHNLSGTIQGKASQIYVPHGALCLELQQYPDAVNQAAFPSIILRPEETYRHISRYAFTTT